MKIEVQDPLWGNITWTDGELSGSPDALLTLKLADPFRRYGHGVGLRLEDAPRDIYGFLDLARVQFPSASVTHDEPLPPAEEPGFLY